MASCHPRKPARDTSMAIRPRLRKGGRMEIFHMWDIVSLLGLPVPTAGRSSYYIQCPCCDENPREKHLNINLKKEVFRCPRCGISGGIFDLYALYTGVPRDKVRRELVERIGPPELMVRPKKNIVEKQKEECPLADIESGTASIRHFLTSCHWRRTTKKTL